MKKFKKWLLGKDARSTWVGCAVAAMAAVTDLMTTGGVVTLGTVGKAAGFAIMGRVMNEIKEVVKDEN